MRHGLTEKESFEVEAAAIDLIGINKLTNVVHGHNSEDRGIMKLEDIEIEFEKQHPEVSCKWCTYVKVKNKKDHEKLLFMIKTDNKPYARFTMNNGNTVNLMDNLNENKT